jgi:hypothetical protein
LTAVMDVGERFRGGGGHAIARFLAEHQECDAGFDVHRQSGPAGGVLSVTCKGCGQSVAYRVAEVGEFAAAGLEAIDVGTGREARVGRAESRPAATPDRPRPRGARKRVLPVWLPRALIAAGIAAVGLALVPLLDSDKGDQEAPAGEQANTATAPVTSAPVAPAPPAVQEDGGAPPPVRLSRRRTPGVFGIGVAPGWESETTSGGNLTLTAPGDMAQVSVFFEFGEREMGDFTEGASEFLDDRHPDGRVGPPRPFRVGPLSARRIIASYPGGTEVAVVLSAGGYAYLLLKQVDHGAPERISRQADAQLTSFRPA